MEYVPSMTVEGWITLVVLSIVLIAILYIISIWIYKRAPSNVAFIRTGLMGTKVCMGRGAIVLPVFHEVTWVSLEAFKLLVSRSRDQAILTKDHIRVDATCDLYTHVGHTSAEILKASRSLGEQTFDADKVRNLLEAKVISAMRSYAATQTLNELHENRDTFAQEVKDKVIGSFNANGLVLEEVTIVNLEQTGKEYFKLDNVFDAEGLKIITAITSEAKKAVHQTEKKTTVAIRQRELDTQLELLEIEKSESFARAQQDKDVSNEQALQLGAKQIYILEQRLAVENREIDNERDLERIRTERDLAITEEASRREVAQVQKVLALQIAEKEQAIALTEKERARQEAEISRATAVAAHEEKARDERHKVSEETALAVRKRALATKIAMLELDQREAFAGAQQDQDVANEQARALSEKQRYLLAQRWEVQQEEIARAQAFEHAQIEKDIAINDQTKAREIALIQKEQEREQADIQRFLAREQEERDREIALAAKTAELEQAEIERLKVVARREQAEKDVDAVRVIADTKTRGELEQMVAETSAKVRTIDEENKAKVTQMHMVTQAEARKTSSEREADATLIRAKATSEAQQIAALGIEKEAGAAGRAEMEIESLRAANTQRMLEAEAKGIEAKAEALAQYDQSSTFLELAQLQISAQRDVNIDQARAMGNALQGAQIRMYGGDDGTVDSIRGLFTKGFGLGEVLEGVAHSLPEGLRERFAQNGLRGVFGRPWGKGNIRHTVERLASLIESSLTKAKKSQLPFEEGLAVLEADSGADVELKEAVQMLRDFNENGLFNDVPFETVWALVVAAAKTDRA